MHQVYGRCHGMKTNVDVHSMAKLPAFRSHEQSAGRVAKRRRVEATGRLEADQKYKPDWAGKELLVFCIRLLHFAWNLPSMQYLKLNSCKESSKLLFSYLVFLGAFSPSQPGVVDVSVIRQFTVFPVFQICSGMQEMTCCQRSSMPPSISSLCTS